jgi:hypothetical protein
MSTDETWTQFAEALEPAGAVLDRAEGRRFLARLARLALRSLEAPPDPRAPEFVAFGPPDVTFGIPNPDNLYQRCVIDPECTYRIRGRRNTIHFLSLGAQAPGVAARPGTASHIDDARLEFGDDGTFEIVVSATRLPGTWLQVSPETRTIMVRQTFLDRANEIAADLEIECVDGPSAPPAPPPDPTEKLLAAAGQVVMLATFWADWVVAFSERAEVNEMFIVDEETHLAVGGDPEVRTPLGRWRIESGEALVIDLRPPSCDYWNVQLANIWSEPLDAPGRTCLNSRDAMLESDGSCRVVVTSDDPGVANWLDTGGHRQGLTSVRWVRAVEHPVPVCRLLPLDAVASTLSS